MSEATTINPLYTKSNSDLGYLDSGVSSLLNGQGLESLLAASLKHRFQVQGEILVSLARQWVPVPCSSRVLLKIRDCSPEELSSSSYLRFSLWDDGIKLNDYELPVRVAHLREVFFSKRTLSRGSRPLPGMFVSRKVDVLKQHANSVASSSDLSGYELSTNLSADSVLKWNLLSKVTLIRKGQVVDVFATGNGIYVTMKGQALEDGVAGSFVMVRNLSSNKEFQAKVVSDNSVRVHL